MLHRYTYMCPLELRARTRASCLGSRAAGGRTSRCIKQYLKLYHKIVIIMCIYIYIYILIITKIMYNSVSQIIQTYRML